MKSKILTQKQSELFFSDQHFWFQITSKLLLLIMPSKSCFLMFLNVWRLLSLNNVAPFA